MPDARCKMREQNDAGERRNSRKCVNPIDRLCPSPSRRLPKDFPADAILKGPGAIDALRGPQVEQTDGGWSKWSVSPLSTSCWLTDG